MFRIFAGTGAMAVLVGALAALLAGCERASGGPVELKFMQAFSPSSEYAHFLVALDKGYYKAEGIDFRQQQGTGSGNAVKVVGTGDSPIGLADAGQVLVGRARGIPVRSVMAVYNMTPVTMFALEDSGIRSLRDLAGKSLGDSPSASNLIIWKAAMARAGLDVGKVNFVAMEPSAKVAALLERKVDTILGQQQLADIEAQGRKAVAIPLSESGLDVISDTIIVNEAFLSKNPDVVRRFLKATIKGFEYARNHPEEAVDIMLKSYPTMDKAVLLRKLQIERPWIWTPAAETSGLGFMREAQWQNLQKVLVEAKVLEQDVDLDRAYTNDSLPRK
jgi:NitT/TauT family transport system substrate-binding protein